jgi:hypothetical protein
MYFWLGKKKKDQMRSFLFDNIRYKSVESQKNNPALKSIIEMAERNGMVGGDIKSFATDIDSEKIKQPTNDSERFDTLYYMVTLLFHHDYISPPAFDFCREFGESIGYSKTTITPIIKEIINGIKLDLAIAEIKESIKREINS